MTSNHKNKKKPPYAIFPCSVYIKDVPIFLKELSHIGLQTGYHIVLIRTYYVAGLRHIETAITHALRSFSTKPIAKTLEVEILLFAAATRQTGQIHAFGVQPGENTCYICLISRLGETQRKPFDLLKELQIDFNTMMAPYGTTSYDENDLRISFFKEQYSITAEELTMMGKDRLEDLVCERVALLFLTK
ncbi:MAG: KEOPS complex subunit Cgi121 [Methanomicrobiales archaeon]|jgi:KEOPS complex subunit Cgi121|nr:KEOPS complex subunit Cgi121 [Methanomicrobiales archaeon]